MAMITDPDLFFTKGCGRCDKFDTPACNAIRWAEGLAALRDICIEAGLQETAKWGHPTYMRNGRNIVIIGAFRDSFRVNFFKAALMRDPEGILEKQGPNSQNAEAIRFDSAQDVADKAPILRAYLAEAIGYADAGIVPPKVVRDVPIPDELTEALDADPELAEAFHALTPGRQKSYAFNLNGAKKSETRISRIAKFRDKIIAGKGALER